MKSYMAVCFSYFLSIAIFLNIDISQGSVATRLRCGGIFKYDYLQIYQWVYQWKNFENRLTFGDVMGKSLVSCFFLRHSVYILLSGTLPQTLDLENFTTTRRSR